MPLPAPDSTVLHPIAGQRGVVFLRSLVQSANVEVGEYTYYDSDGDFLAFERDAVLYALGPERLIVGRFCAIASGVRFLMPGASHADVGPLTVRRLRSAVGDDVGHRHARAEQWRHGRRPR